MPTAHEIMQRLSEIHAARTAAMQPLAEILEERQRLLDALAATEEPYRKAYEGARAGGWTTDELTGFGAEEPTGRPKRKQSRRRTSGKSLSPAPATATVQEAAQTETGHQTPVTASSPL
ncbi:hypothetical protein [Streptomyces ehimensis]|uniref:Uncharacterized protein n=1 Tax=Streptomyces ehimensis TaxID=68195 RepID=A0ABV9BQS2_9ACTN